MEIARYWRLNGQRYSLKGSICTNCGKPNLSERPVCDGCGRSTTEARDVNGFDVQNIVPVSQIAAK
jgi:uncharacterized OB-fold protein